MAVVPVDPQPTAPAAPGVRLDPSLSFEAWRLLGAGLSTGYDDSCWALGDWIAFGRARYGRYYRDALFATGPYPDDGAAPDDPIALAPSLPFGG